MPPNKSRAAASCYRHTRRYTPEQSACRKFRAQLVRYLAGTPGLREFQAELEQLDSVKDLMTAVDKLLGI